MGDEPPADAVWEREIRGPPINPVENWAASPKREAELRAMPYRDYLDTPEWRYRRRQAIKSAERRCSRCRRFSSRLQVHHRTYDRVGNEHPDDLEVLCARCHQQEHGIPS